MRKNGYKWLIGALLVTVMSIVWYRVTKQDLPIADIENARAAILKAEKRLAREYAGVTLGEAIQTYDSAMRKWQEENEKWFFRRDFTDARILANRAESLALQAYNKAGKDSKNLKYFLTDRLKSIQQKLQWYDSLYSKMPLKNTHFQEIGRARMLYDEGLGAFHKSNYTRSVQMLDSAELLIDIVNNHARKWLRKYLEQFPLWQEWIAENVAYSKKNKCTTIIVDKLERKCYLYKKGRIEATFPAELGVNWIGDKMYQGDRATPEGNYTIVEKKAGNNSKYYKALLLDYPNEEDKKRFSENKQSGALRPDKKIGNLIEIHGHGGKGTDWTNGCIALADKDMDRLFDASQQGTLVTIVGSLNSFDEIINPE
jgi:L,D-peptidoglycan transpeptidase YkuD (ErfK/YbiS/YcfS/YnhG family)